MGVTDGFCWLTFLTSFQKCSCIVYRCQSQYRIREFRREESADGGIEDNCLWWDLKSSGSDVYYS